MPWDIAISCRPFWTTSLITQIICTEQLTKNNIFLWAEVSVTEMCDSWIILRSILQKSSVRNCLLVWHDDIKWKHFRVPAHLCGEFTGHRWILRHKGQWRGVLMFSLICAWISGWINNREAGGLRRYHAHYNVTVMISRELYNNICDLRPRDLSMRE